ncbi:MAG: hypothetical protein V7K69_27260 [Nostoc sp.]|uniref:hypothetical protein n=1 Tax=Nostoc sp. TaxID=1180 RepID=UPI002FFA37DC
MLFETLILRPSSGTVDVKSVSAWLDALPYSFLDPIEGNYWHLSATPRLMALNKQTRIGNPNKFPPGILVAVAPDEVYLAAQADADDLARGLEFVQWLVANGRWMATVDGVDIGVIDDPCLLFPAGLPDPLLLIDDPTILPITTGKLVTWSSESDGELRTFAIHSSDRWRYETSKRTLQGRLSPNAIAAWNAAMEAINPDDPELPDHPDPATAVSMDIDTPEGSDWAYFDTVAPPAAYLPIVEMIARWTNSLDLWIPGTQVEDMTEVILLECDR